MWRLVFLLVSLGGALFSRKSLGSFRDLETKQYHAGCHSKEPAYGPSSNYSDAVKLSEAGRLVKTIRNGQLLSVELPNPLWPNASQTIMVVHMWGTPHEQGLAQGQLLGHQIRPFVDGAWTYLEQQVEGVLKVVPAWLRRAIADLGLAAALDATEVITRLYTPQAFYDNLRGIAEGSGVEYQKLVRVHMLAGLTQGKCSHVGLWGSALSSAAGTKALQLRALDWDMDGPFRNFAAVMVFHSNDKKDGNSFVTFGFPGFVGALAGMNDKKLAISEIGVSFPDPSFGSESRIGVPFIFMLREILQYDTTLAQATERMKKHRRTCDLILGVGDGKISAVRGYQYSYSVLTEISEKNFLPVNATWHAPIPDAIYWGMDWICPTFNKVLGDEIRRYHGSITPQVARQYISATTMTGDNLSVWYDLTNSLAWVAFAAPFNVGGPKESYWRQYLEVDVSALIAVAKPK